MLAGTGSTHPLRTLDQTMHEILAPCHLIAIIKVAQQRTVKIAVADMADDRRQQVEAGPIPFSLPHALREAGKRDHNNRPPHPRPPAQVPPRPKIVVPSPP